MTELEFKVTDPSAYGTGNINILYSSSVSTGSVTLPVAQYGTLASQDTLIVNGGIYEQIDFKPIPQEIMDNANTEWED